MGEHLLLNEVRQRTVAPPGYALFEALLEVIEGYHAQFGSRVFHAADVRLACAQQLWARLASRYPALAMSPRFDGLRLQFVKLIPTSFRPHRQPSSREVDSLERLVNLTAQAKNAAP